MLVDGQPAQAIPADDRGLAYGDGLFETIAVRDGRCLAWDAHLARLAHGCAVLGFDAPDPCELAADRDHLLGAAAPHGVLKLVVTRGSGGRGYRPPEPARARRIASLHPWPASADPATAAQPVRAWICHQRLSAQPALAGLKHLNRLEQVLASREWPGEDYYEGLMLDADGALVEGTRSNLVVVHGRVVSTPPLAHCGVRGIVRDALLARAPTLGLAVRETTLDLAALATADGILLCNSIIGLRVVASVDHLALRADPQPVAALTLRSALRTDAVIP